jgi:excisionase family DNA binding protein
VDDDELLLTVGETARLLRLSRAFTYELVARGDLPVLRFGRRVLVPRQALKRYPSERSDGDGEMLTKPL